MFDQTRSMSLSRWLIGAIAMPWFGVSSLAAQQDAHRLVRCSPSLNRPPRSSRRQPQATAPIARPSVPAPVGLTGQLADWLEIRGEFRGRLEGFSGGAFKPDNSDGYMLDRFRLNATVTPTPLAKFVVQVQDARVFDKDDRRHSRPRSATRWTCAWRMANSAARETWCAPAGKSWRSASSASSGT